jgi:hypothetical protein
MVLRADMKRLKSIEHRGLQKHRYAVRSLGLRQLPNWNPAPIECHGHLSIDSPMKAGADLDTSFGRIFRHRI